MKSYHIRCPKCNNNHSFYCYGKDSNGYQKYHCRNCCLQNAPEDEPVYQFINKKRSESKPYFVYMTATANKFLRRYYGKVNEYLASSENTIPE